MEYYKDGIGDHSPSSWRDAEMIREELIARGVKLPILKNTVLRYTSKVAGCDRKQGLR